MFGCVQNQLIKMQVKPAAEFEARVADFAAERESELPVHLDGHGVVAIDTANQDVVIL
jgi:hypothetical protein